MNTKDTKNCALPPRCQFTVLKNITVKDTYFIMTVIIIISGPQVSSVSAAADSQFRAFAMLFILSAGRIGGLQVALHSYGFS